ncbi:MAG: hypothetical protein R2750_13385 [Bacteroidales bacterium]
MAAFGSSRQMNSKLNIKEININLSSKRPRAIAANRYAQIKKMRKLIPLVSLILTLFSCSVSPEKNTNKENQKFEIIQVQFLPSFVSPSILTCDLTTDKILFQRFGYRNKLKVHPPEGSGDVIEVFSPKTSYYFIDSLNSIIIKDSILDRCTKSDFTDMKLEAYDGIWTSIIITDNQNSIKDFELDNYGTENQYRLILKLLEVCIKNETDSLNLDYLNKLEKHFK